MSKKSDAVAPKDRAPALRALRNLKMARSAHAFVRGSTAKFYEWLESAEGLKLPQGPAVWICGDCHIGNLGPIASAKGGISIEIRDLDQTVIGNPAHDLIRLALSLASAARGSDLPGVITARMIERVIEGYELAFDEDRKKREELEEPKAVAKALKTALKRKWKQLAEERIEDEKPMIPLGKRFWPLSAEERKEIERLFADEKTRHLITALRGRDDDAQVELLDAAYWVKGCSSLGNLRYAVLVAVGDKRDELCLIDIKEAVTAIAPHAPKAAMPKDNAERVLEGARYLSPALGNRLLPAHLGDKPVFLRELLPQDLKLEIETLDQDDAEGVAKFLAYVVGRAHARQMDDDARQEWRKQLAANRSKQLDAPSWLWSSVVSLMMTHEGAYLEHCRKYAMGE